MSSFPDQSTYISSPSSSNVLLLFVYLKLQLTRTHRIFNLGLIHAPAVIQITNINCPHVSRGATVYLRTISDNSPHPEAASPTIRFPECGRLYKISVCDDKIAILSQNQEDHATDGQTRWWNWKTGKLLGVCISFRIHYLLYAFIKPYSKGSSICIM